MHFLAFLINIVYIYDVDYYALSRERLCENFNLNSQLIGFQLDSKKEEDIGVK